MVNEILIDYNALPRSTRERLAASTRARPQLAPLLKDLRHAGMSTTRWILLALICGLALMGLTRIGFGQIDPQINHFGQFDQIDAQIDAVQSPWLIPAYCLSIFLLVASLLGLALLHRWRKALPFRPGRYLFPLDFVDARSSQLRILPLSKFSSFTAVQQHGRTVLTIHFESGGSEQFTVSSKAKAEALLQQLRQLRDMLGRALEVQDLDTLSRYDLFVDVRTQGGFSAFQGKVPPETSGGPRILEGPPRLGLRWLVALAAGVVLGSSLWFFRNQLSDEQAFAAAKEKGTGTAFLVYARSGRRHVAEAKELGARAHFSLCEQTGTELCWREFLFRWSDSPLSKEAREDRLPRAVLKATSDNVSLLRQFRERYPDSVVDAEAKARLQALRHKLYTQALSEFLRQASTGTPGLVLFMSKLLAHLEATDNPQVLVRFRREESSSLQKADEQLGKAMTREGHPMAQASPYFDDAHTRPLEKAITLALSNGFRRIFTQDLLALETGPALPESQDATAQSVPEIDIVYTVEWSGATYRAEKGGREFVGINVRFDTRMSVPKEKPLDFSLTVDPPEHFSVEYTRYRGRLSRDFGEGGPDDGRVYEIMALRAFDELSEQLSQILFRADSQVLKAGGLSTAPRP